LENALKPDQPRIVILSAPSGTGKTTIVRSLMERLPLLAFSISATTRKPRAHEVDGRDYLFLEEADFKRRIEAGAFVEWEEVYPGRYYGTLWTEIERIQTAGQTPIFDVDVYGGLALKKRFGANSLSIFLEPPTLEVLSERLRKRGTEAEAEIELRLQKATHELTYASLFDLRIVNGDLAAAIDQVHLSVESFLGA